MTITPPATVDPATMFGQTDVHRSMHIETDEMVLAPVEVFSATYWTAVYVGRKLAETFPADRSGYLAAMTTAVALHAQEVAAL